MRERIEIRLELLSPAFVSGANQSAAEFRAGSVRGLLRWWWRAVVGHRVESPSKLLTWESEIFGSVHPPRKSPLRISVVEEKTGLWDRGSQPFESGFFYEYRSGERSGKMDLLVYLAYGPVGPLTKEERRDVNKLDPEFLERPGRPKRGPLLRRPAVKEGSSHRLVLEWQRDALTDDRLREIVKAACAWSTLGGIGTRSRKGFGQLEGQVLSVSDGIGEWVHGTWEDFKEALMEDGPGVPLRELPPYPQLEYRRIKIDPRPRDDWKKALGAAGFAYRSLKKESGEGEWLTGYASKSRSSGSDGRRASSLLIGLIRDGNRNYRGFLCLLPCKKRPEEDGQGLDRFLEAFERVEFPG